MKNQRGGRMRSQKNGTLTLRGWVGALGSEKLKTKQFFNLFSKGERYHIWSDNVLTMYRWYETGSWIQVSRQKGVGGPVAQYIKVMARVVSCVKLNNTYGSWYKGMFTAGKCVECNELEACFISVDRIPNFHEKEDE